MKRVMLFVLAVALVGSDVFGDEKPLPAKQVQFQIRHCEGDPLGSKKAGTLTVLSNPTVVTTENGTGTVQIGGEIPVVDEVTKTKHLVHVGSKIEVKRGPIKDGKVSVLFTISNTTVDERSDVRTQFKTETTQSFATVKFGEIFKIRLTKLGTEKQEWVEITVDELR